MPQRLFCSFFLPIALFLALSPAVSAQVSGTVLDERGESLPYVSVYLRGTSNGTSANGDGVFRLQVPKGKHDLVFQYIGYKQHIETIVVEDKPVRITVRMKPDELLLAEVEIRDEDPAYRIMRKVIEKRPTYRHKVTDYSFDAYVKGFHRIVDAPKKVFGKDLGTMDGMLDTNRTGVLYLSESVSKVYVQDKKMKEVMVSSKVSGENNGVSFNRAMATDFTFYDERINIDRDMLSPLADNAFSYYNFKLLGKSQDENGYNIYKIAVIPKRNSDPVFAGHLYVVDDWYNLAGADLYLTGAAIKQPILDTLRIRQGFVPLEKPDTWVLLSQLTTFKFGIFGFKIEGLFNGIFSNYQINRAYQSGFFGRETFKVEKDATQRDSSYWTGIRPIPLTPLEVRDYVRKDSIREIRDSKVYKDSIDRKNNRFSPGDLLFGYTWQNSWRNFAVSWPSATDWVQFNTVQGWLVDIHPTLSKKSDSYGTRFWRAEGTLNYGFAEKRWRGGLSLERRFESIHYTTADISGGLTTAQYNSQDPVSVFINTTHSLFLKRNHMKLYEKAFARVGWSQRVAPGVKLRASVEYADRRPLSNHSDFTWRKGEGRSYTSNNPPNVPADAPAFAGNQALLLDFGVEFRFAEPYATYPDRREYQTSKWPVLAIHYEKAISGVAGSDANFDVIQAEISKTNLNFGLFGHTDARLLVGGFLNKRNMSFMDWQHANGNRAFFTIPRLYNKQFFLLPYYDFSTNGNFLEAHCQHHMEGWLLDKVPGLRRLHLKEVVAARLYWADRYLTALPDGGQNPYWEVSAGLENIGFGAFRLLRVDVVWGFWGQKHQNTGVLFSFSL